MNTSEYRDWLEAAAKIEDGHFNMNAGISLGGLVLIILLVALLF